MILLALLTACSSQEPCDSSQFICDTGATSSQTSTTPGTIDTTEGTWIEVVRRPGCPVDPDKFTVSIRTSGVAETAYVNIWSEGEASGFNETHPLYGQGANGGGAELAIELRDAATPQQYQPGTATTYVCGEHDLDDSLTYAIRIYDAAGSLLDCAAFSARADAEAVVAAALSGNLDEPNTIPQREDLTADNCSFWHLPGQ